VARLTLPELTRSGSPWYAYIVSKKQQQQLEDIMRKNTKIPAGATARTAAETQRVLELRRSAAASPHGGRKPRGASKRQAIAEYR